MSAPTADPSERARVLIARGAVAVRAAQLAQWPVALLLGSSTGVEHATLAAAAYAPALAWALVWVTVTLTRRQILAWTPFVDLPVTAASLIAAGLACRAADANSWANAGFALSLAAVVAVAATWPPLWTGGATVVLAAAYLVGVHRSLSVGATERASAVGNVAIMAAGAALAAAAAHYLVRQAESLGRTRAELSDAQERLGVERVRDDERARQYRTLHDTVLSTLSALARGGLDPSDPAIRQRCAADADYLRGLISAQGLSGSSRLQGELAAVGRAQAALGLRVQQHCADIPADLPPAVITALTDACREALNNVIKHSGTAHAWVTTVGPAAGAASSGVQVSVTDRGVGFDVARTRAGLGLRESISGRMAEVGGAVFIDSSPGQGTTVELRWPA